MQYTDGFEHIRMNKSRIYRRRRVRLVLIVLVIAVLVTVFFRSSYNRVTHVYIVGNEYVSLKSILQASGIIEGTDYFIGFPKAKIEQSIIKQVQAVQSVEFVKDFPGKVTLQVHVYPKVAIEFDSSNTWSLVLADGNNWPITDNTSMLDVPILSNWKHDDPNRLLLCKTLSEIEDADLSAISEILPAPSASYPDKIMLYTKLPFEVYTTISYLQNKIVNLDAYLAKLEEQGIKQGVITMLEVDSYAPFDIPLE